MNIALLASCQMSIITMNCRLAFGYQIRKKATGLRSGQMRRLEGKGARGSRDPEGAKFYLLQRGKDVAEANRNVAHGLWLRVLRQAPMFFSCPAFMKPYLCPLSAQENSLG